MMRLYHDLPSGSVDRARGLRHNATEAEKRLWKALRESLGPAKFRRQVPVGPYFADFLSFSAKLIVEVDGGQHALQSEQDAARTHFLKSQGYRVLRFWNNDVLENTPGVLETIAAALRPLPPGEGRGEGEQKPTQSPYSPSPSRAARGPLPLPMGEGRKE
ncbi:endonuclease domain-containing protein [Allosphingosinicella vermicomposti]|uniref:endonuclease domain-containing protein n=1 Tax=Allosphingosinicella vermicomposti TaxID=614671 RepID=UPI001FE0CB21|nr:endonuclease domain-containing protein [Allosphingosinicella vermicomposti]